MDESKSLKQIKPQRTPMEKLPQLVAASPINGAIYFSTLKSVWAGDLL